jgi:hypothetical protein
VRVKKLGLFRSLKRQKRFFFHGTTNLGSML